MNNSNEFRTAASHREQCLRRIRSIVDLVQQQHQQQQRQPEVQQSGGNIFVDSNNDNNDNDKCWTLLQPGLKWLRFGSNNSGPTTPKPKILRVPGAKAVLRSVLHGEREVLRTVCGCSCVNDDWSRVFLLLPVTTNEDDCDCDYDNDNKSVELQLESLVSDTHFDGFVVLDLASVIDGNCDDDDDDDEKDSSDTPIHEWSKIPPGLHSNTCVSDCIVSIRTCRVYKNSFLSRTSVGSHAVVMNNGHVSSCSEQQRQLHPLGTLKITVGAESGGGRPLLLPAESTMRDVSRQLVLVPGNNSNSNNSNSSKPEQPNESLHSPFTFNVVSSGSILRDTPTVRNVFLHPSSSVEAASSVTNAVLLDHSRITNASSASNVALQWNATISDHSKLDNVLMMEHSHCGPASIVASSVLGPDAHASAGEIHSSVFGPNTNAHHQSLLVGVLWPLGRGNVAYGANVGSNHTGRLPDQECSAGEGVFWGLGCLAKLPIDLSAAPYTMVAGGTALGPQRIAMPFSLVVQGGASKNNKNKHQQQTNEIVPGWVLQHSPYTLVRNDQKYATRRKAKRHADYTGWRIIRRSTVERCVAARRALRRTLAATNTDGAPGLSLRDVPGIGDCVLTKRARDGGIEAYDNGIRLYALRGLLAWLQSEAVAVATVTLDDAASRILAAFAFAFATATTTTTTDGKFEKDGSEPSLEAVEWPSFPWDDDDDDDEPTREWEYQRRLLVDEFPMRSSKKNNSSNSSSSNEEEPAFWFGHLLPSPRNSNGTKDHDHDKSNNTKNNNNNNNNNNNKNNDELLLILAWIESLLRKLVELEKDFAERVVKSKRRDDVRGASIVPGYADFHVVAEDDPVVTGVRRAATETEKMVQNVLTLLSV